MISLNAATQVPDPMFPGLTYPAPTCEHDDDASCDVCGARGAWFTDPRYNVALCAECLRDGAEAWLVAI